MTIGPGLTTVHGTFIIFCSGQQIFESDLGTHHRKQRRMLNPVFSVTYLKSMTDTFYSVAHRVRLSPRLQAPNDSHKSHRWSRVSIQRLALR